MHPCDTFGRHLQGSPIPNRTAVWHPTHLHGVPWAIGSRAAWTRFQAAFH